MRVRWTTEVIGSDLTEIVNEVVFVANRFFGSQAPDEQREVFLQGLMDRADINITENVKITSGAGVASTVDYLAVVVIDFEAPARRS